VVAAEGDGRWVEYAGGYSDMLAQRGGRDLAAKAARTAAREIARERPAAADAAQPAAPTRQRKLSFKEKHLLDTLPRTLDMLAAEIKDLEARLADPGLYGRDRAGFEAVTRDLAEAQARLAAAEDEWLRLETMREEMGG
jgi:ATP-binding cassette subfamily F protein uup